MERSLLNPEGIWSYLAPEQKLRVYSEIRYEREVKTLDPRVFYLDRKETGENVKLSFVSALGILDKCKFRLGSVNVPKTVGELVSDVMKEANYSDWEVIGLENVSLNGDIGLMSCRDALRQIAFAARAFASDAGGKIKVFKLDLSLSEHIDQSMILRPLTFKMIREVTGIEITSHTFVQDSKDTTIANGFLKKGDRDYLFDTAVTNFRSNPALSGETLSSHWERVHVPQDGNYVWVGNRYTDETSVLSVKVGENPKVGLETNLKRDFFPNLTQ